MILEIREGQIIKSSYLWLSSILVCTLFCSFNTASAKANSADSLVSLSHIRQKILVDSVAGLMGETITVSGTANIGAGLLHERYLQVFIQNDSAGISLFKNTIDEPLTQGDSVVATGEVKKYFGLTEVEVEEYEVYPGKNSVSKPIKLSKAIGAPEVYEGMLVAGTGVIKDKGNRYNGK